MEESPRFRPAGDLDLIYISGLLGFHHFQPHPHFVDVPLGRFFFLSYAVAFNKGVFLMLVMLSLLIG
jgi:hypothetical protein